MSPLVLVVDDYADGRELVVDILSAADVRVEEAATGTEALEKALRLRPDLILMDLALPELDGWEVTRRLRQEPSMRGVRIIAVTAHAQESYLEAARAAGCMTVLTKPFAPDVLLRLVLDATSSGADAPAGS